jgi:fucose permease
MWRKVLAHGSAFFVGLFIGFFLVIAPLFAGGDPTEYIIPVLIVMVLFFISGIILGWAVPDSMTFISLSFPTFLMVALLGISDRPDEAFYISLFIIYPLVVLISSFAGEKAGSWIRNRKK